MISMSTQPAVWDKIVAAAEKFAKSKTGEQVGRFARLFGVGIVTYAVTHNGVAGLSVASVLELAFRQVWPA